MAWWRIHTRFPVTIHEVMEMIPKKSLAVTIWIMVIVLVMTAACVSPAETPVTHGPGNSPRTGVVQDPAARIPVSPASTAGGTGYTTHVPFTIQLGRPTDHSINVNVLPMENLELFAEYHNTSETTVLRTPVTTAGKGVPVNLVLSGLTPDTGYLYHLCYQRPGNTTIQCSPDYSFHTWRAPGSSFVFDVQADSHLDERANEQLYIRTLENELSDKPDFLIDLGDTFMTEKLPAKDSEAVLQQYIRQRTDLSVIGHSIPLYLVLGNHDGEAGYSTDNGRNTLAPLSLQFRKQYFPNPEPDGFYTGNSVNDSVTGKKQDYYAWEWGEALFVVLDPYWYTTTKPGGTADGWTWTLGETQYKWLEQTLQQSNAKYKFVFAHQLVGGDSQGRGGTEFASLYEWGGKNLDGSYGFDQYRPGWGMPIHQLLVDNNVTAFFHGHDHFFAKQELDGITYQEVPQPATSSSPKDSPGAEYGYTRGEMLGSPGHLRITVSPESALAEYIWSGLPADNKSGVKNGAVIYSYTLSPQVTS